MKKILCVALGLMMVAVGANAQIMSHKITKSTKTTVAPVGRKVVEDAKVFYVEIDRDGEVITVNRKGAENITLQYDQMQTIMNSPEAKRLIFNYQGKPVCDRLVTAASHLCELSIYLADGSVLLLTGRSLDDE